MLSDSDWGDSYNYIVVDCIQDSWTQKMENTYTVCAWWTHGSIIFDSCTVCDNDISCKNVSVKCLLQEFVDHKPAAYEKYGLKLTFG